MRSGTLDRRIELQSKGSPSGFDPTSGTWSTYETVYAHKMDARGVERFVGKQFAAEATQAYRIRYRTDVDPTHRVKDGSELWKIIATQEDASERRRAATVLMVRRFNPNDTEA